MEVERVSSRCIGRNTNGQRCKRRTAMTPYCWVHLQKEKNVRIKPSTIEDAGLGLWTTKEVKKNHPVVDYGGKRVETHDADYGGEYVLELKDTDPYIYMDGAKSNTRLGAYANHKQGPAANARFLAKPDLSDGQVVANRNIPAGREVFVNYGSNYGFPARKKVIRRPRRTDDEVENELDRVMALLPEGIRLTLPAWRRRRRNEARQASVLSDEWRARESRRQLAEAEAALARYLRTR